MFYELYVDSLILINFVMNLYLLLLVNRSTHCTATRLRLILGALTGAVLYLLPFLFGGPAWFRFLAGALTGMTAMIFAAFKVRSLGAFLQITGQLFMYSFFIGGFLLFMIRSLPFLRGILTGMSGIMGAGAVIFLIFFYGKRRREQSDLCKVTLISRERKVTVMALIDSGNSLAEPISGKPVSVIDREVLAELWSDFQMQEGCGPKLRVIPYHSIGRKRGILYGYLLEELQIDLGGMIKVCRDVYVASGQEDISAGEKGDDRVRMILNPLILRG